MKWKLQWVNGNLLMVTLQLVSYPDSDRDREPCNSKQKPILDEDFDDETDLNLVSKQKEKFLLNNYFSFIWDPHFAGGKWLILSIGD